MSASILSINLGRVRPEPGSGLGRSAIDKRPVAGPVWAGELGLSGDEIADSKHHGGVDQAVYAFAREDLARWEIQLGRALRAGQFGENLTTIGIDLAASVVGERWRCGAVEFEVSAPRIPCATFQGFLGERGWVRRFTADGRPGAYLRVIAAGWLRVGEQIAVISRPDHGLTIGETFAALTVRAESLPRLLEAPELPVEYHDRARAYLGGREK